MFTTRPWQAGDREALIALHEKLQLGELPAKLAEVVVVADEKTGKPIMFLGTRETREVYTWVDPNWSTPIWRWTAFKEAHENLREQVLAKGITEVLAFLHPRVAKSFGRRLVDKLGWVRVKLECLARDLRR